ncbi:NAD-dependent dihydroorotate dehydrogenase B electron transfer subunit [candidate division WOR-3 bacterium]|nr:NAD-dependent dihydroorotate dehydrogenase B electron transfer subunit [candidate division WOR-3 bacterium]
MRKQKARICEHTELGPGLHSFWLELPEPDDVRPGQFYEIKTAVRFLRRAISLADKIEDRLRFIIRVVGPGTEWMSGLKPGENLDIIGPLGKGVKIPEEGSLTLLGGGIGIAPLLYLARVLSGKGLRVNALLAACTREELICTEEFGSLCSEVVTATDDGSCGRKGLLTQVLPSLQCYKESSAFYACGPEPMLKALKELDIQSPVYAFLESRMGCGIGLCMGCAIKHTDGGYRRVCLDGPVFNLEDITL